MAVLLVACGGAPQEPLDTNPEAILGSQPALSGIACSVGWREASPNQGPPRIPCELATEVRLTTSGHFPPSERPSTACCAPRPEVCSPTDCGCLLREGPWIDFALAADAGVAWPYTGPKRMCPYRVSCTPATDGGVAELYCLEP